MVNASSRRRGIPGGAWDTGHPGKDVGLRVLSYRVNGNPKMVLIIIENSVSRGSQGRNGIGWIFSIRYINLSFIHFLSKFQKLLIHFLSMFQKSLIHFLSMFQKPLIHFLSMFRKPLIHFLSKFQKLLIYFGKSIIHFLVNTHNFLVKTPHFLAKACHLIANLKVKPNDKKGNKSACKHRNNRRIMLCEKVKNFCHNL